MPVLAPEDVAPPSALLRRQRLDERDRLTDDAILHGLALPVQLLELGCELLGPCLVLGEDQLEGGIGAAQPARGVDARRESEADRGGVDRRRVDMGAPHERLQPGPPCGRERSEPRCREGAVLVEQRDDVRDGRERDEVELASNRRAVRAEQRLAELEDDPGPAELRERVVGRPGGDDRAVGKVAGR